MLSGIGSADHLKASGIRPVCDLPGVGQNLMDHPCLIMQFTSKRGFPIQRVDRPWNKLAAGVRWVFTQDGIAASNIWEAGGMIRGNADVDFANLHTHFAPIAFEYDGPKIRLSLGFGIHVDVCRPKSRGAVTLKSENPQAPPNIRFNYLQAQSDLQQMVEGVMRARELVATRAFDDFRDVELDPGPSIRTETEIAAWIRQNVATDFHPCGTCALGHTQNSVVDPSFRVKGIERLRVVDASVFPMIPSANLNAPTQMIAARAADLIAGKAQLNPIDVAGGRRT
jgi:choline dehydrogenase